MKFFIPFILVLLAACAQQPRLEAPPRPPRDSIAAYTLEGRVSVRRGDSARQAALFWRHGAARDEIELSGPLGQKAARLSRDASGARLETAAREVVTAADWDGLAERVLGVPLPLDNIAHWLTGSFAPGSVVTRDDAGRPREASENGWRIDYLAYESAAPDALPALIELRRADIEVRLKVDTWQLD